MHSKSWSRRELNPRPWKRWWCFLHAYPYFHVKVPVDRARWNSSATNSETVNSCRSSSFLLSFSGIALQQSSESASRQTVFQAASWKLREESVLAFVWWHGLITVVQVSSRHACIILIFKSKPVGPKMPSSFRFSTRASHERGFRTNRMVGWGFQPEGWQRFCPPWFGFKRFHAFPSPLLVTGLG